MPVGIHAILGGERRDRNLRLARDALPEWAVDHDDSLLRVLGCEQRELRSEIGLHVTKIIEMVSREVVERHHVEVHAIDAVAGSRMSRDLNRDALDLLFDHSGE